MIRLASDSKCVENQKARSWLEPRNGLESDLIGAGQRDERTIDHPVLANCHPAVKPEVCALNPSNIERGQAVRRGILAVARLCIEQEKRLPTYDVLGRLLGCDHNRIGHHIKRLRRDGALVVQRGAGNRLYIHEVRL